MSGEILEGGCRCRAVRYRIRGDVILSAVCHCESCRRAHAAPAVAWAMFRSSQFEPTAGEQAIHESSPGVRRGFCARCGTQMSFTADYMPGLIDIATGSLDAPELMPPTFHYWESKRLPWLRFDDGLPRYAEFPPMDDLD